jgi:hypothetical protein
MLILIARRRQAVAALSKALGNPVQGARDEFSMRSFVTVPSAKVAHSCGGRLGSRDKYRPTASGKSAVCVCRGIVTNRRAHYVLFQACSRVLASISAGVWQGDVATIQRNVPLTSAGDAYKTFDYLEVVQDLVRIPATTFGSGLDIFRSARFRCPHFCHVLIPRDLLRCAERSRRDKAGYHRYRA